MNDITIRGERYVIIAQQSTSDSGSKFFGRYRFTLSRPSDGTMWSAYGKRVMHNSRLTEIPKG